MENVVSKTGRVSSGKFFTQQALAERLGLSWRTLERWRSTGDGPVFVRLGRCVAYREEDVEAWLVSNSHRSHAAELAKVA